MASLRVPPLRVSVTATVIGSVIPAHTRGFQQVSTNPASHLSNFEVLQHFLAQKKETDRLASALAEGSRRRETRGKLEYPIELDSKDGFDVPEQLEPITAERQKEIGEAERRGLSEDLVWVQNEVLKYLCADHSKTAYQTAEGVRDLAIKLQEYDMSKAEVLQCVNNAPTLPVELYCTLEGVDDRFPDTQHETLYEIGGQVRASLLDEIPAELVPFSSRAQLDMGGLRPAFPPPPGFFAAAGVDIGVNEEEFIHEAEWGKDHETGVGEEVENDME